ncbi:uncharacterized protein LOC123556563 [Mercenaria mercenaria]|uniref:uncharacterized protein LOC123556563 n=1 Tax=Mercenaria mercenaria TaxID=6596 RepID=UPI00234F2F04|nr:uncharacterized protein LOC123556563 [Mercenaria mercenaria]
MHDPTYNLQGEPDAYINGTTNDDLTDIWVLRDDSSPTCITADDDAHKCHSGGLLEHETVLDEPQDHYDLINDSDIEESETDLKRIESARPDRDHLRPYYKLPERRHNYEQMVKIFQPLIVTNVIVRRLLPHLPFLSDPGRIRTVEERDPRAAVIYLIDELCSNGNTEPGRWKQFIQALERCGYKYIVETLRGQEPVDHTYQREYLKIITPVLRELINPSELLTILWACDVISNEDKEEIGQIERNWGALAAADKLLDLVPRRHRFWYAHLVDALKTAGRTDAAEILAIPEILNCKEEKEESKIQTACKVEGNINGLSLEMPDREYLEMDESMKGTVPDNCEYLNCDELYSEGESEQLDALYLHMRLPNNHFESISCNSERISRHTTQVNQTEQRDEEIVFGELYSSSDIVNKFPSGSLLENGQKEYLTYISTENLASFANQNKDSGTGVSKTNNRSDIYKYEPPLPASTAPGTPGQQNVQDNFRMDYEIDNNSSIADDISETSSVEVVKLPVPERKKCHFPEHTATSSEKVKVLNKPPIPTPRKRRSLREATVPANQTFVDVQSFSAGEKEADVRVTTPTLVEIEEDKKTSSEDGEETHIKKIIGDLGDTPILVEEEIESTTFAGPKQPARAKVKASIFKRRKKWRKFQRSKLTSRRKSLHIPAMLFQQSQTDAWMLDKGKQGKALLNRERMVTPRKGRNHVEEVDEDFKSKSLPTNLGKVLQIEDNTSALKETTGNGENKGETCDTQLYYSEPFRCHRGKEDEDIFTTVGQIRPTKSRHSGNISTLQPSFTIKQRRKSETDELLEILESCSIKSNEDACNLKSNAEIKTISKENLDPKLRKNLEKVRDLECKLNHLVHDGKVLEWRLQLQEDVNEILKRNRQIASKLGVKEKEAKALEAAISGDMMDPEEFVPACNLEICTSGSLSESENRTLKTENIPKDRDGLTEDSTAVYIARKELQLENIDKDSAFYSKFTTKL